MWLYFHTLVYLYICRSLATANIEAQVGKWPPCTLCTGASTGTPCTGAAAGCNHIKQPSLLHTPFLSSLSTCGNIWNHVGPCGTVWNRLEPHRTIWNYVEPNGTTQNHLELCGTKISTPSITQTLFVPVVQTTANFVFSAENTDTIKLTSQLITWLCSDIASIGPFITKLIRLSLFLLFLLQNLLTRFTHFLWKVHQCLTCISILKYL